MKSYSQFLKFKINEGISIKTTADLNIIGKIYKDKLVIDEKKGEMGETFDAEGYQEGMTDVDTRLVYLDVSGYTLSLDFFKNIKLDDGLYHNKEEFIEWFIEEYGEGKYWKTGFDLNLLGDSETNKSPLEDLTTLGELLEYLNDDEYMDFSLSLNIDYKGFIGSSYSSPSKINDGDVIANEGDFNGEYCHCYIGKTNYSNNFTFDFNDEFLTYPVVKAHEDFDYFYQGVFNVNSKMVKDYVKDPDEENVQEGDTDDDEPSDFDWQLYWDMIRDEYKVFKPRNK